MNKKHIPIILLGFIISINITARDIPTVLVNELPKEGISFGGELYFFEDIQDTFNVMSLEKLSDSLFQNLTKKEIQRGKKTIWWIKIKGYNPTPTTVQSLLFHNKRGYTKAFFLENGISQEKYIGYLTNPRYRNGFLQHQFTVVNFPPHDTLNIYIRFVVAYNEIYLPEFELYPAKEGWERVAQLTDDRIPFYILTGSYLGVIFFFSLFSFLQYFQHRDKVYLFYVFYLFSVFLSYWIRASRQFQNYFTPYNEHWYEYFNAPLIFINGLTYLMLFQSFLNPNNEEENKHKKTVLILATVVGLLLIIDLVLKYFQLYPFYHQLFRKEVSFLGIPFLYVIWSSFKLKFSAYHYFIAGSLALVFFSVISILNNEFLNDALGFEIIKSSFWKLPLSAMQVGILVEIVFFNIALGYRTKTIMKERNQARKIIFLTKKENDALQEKIAISTNSPNPTSNEVTQSLLHFPSREGYEFLNKKDILYCKADGNYCLIYLHGNKKIIATKTLAEIHRHLSEEYFFRIHNSHLVNLKYIKKYIKGNGGFVVLTNETELQVARGKKKALLQHLKLK